MAMNANESMARRALGRLALPLAHVGKVLAAALWLRFIKERGVVEPYIIKTPSFNFNQTLACSAIACNWQSPYAAAS